MGYNISAKESPKGLKLITSDAYKGTLCVASRPAARFLLIFFRLSEIRAVNVYFLFFLRHFSWLR